MTRGFCEPAHVLCFVPEVLDFGRGDGGTRRDLRTREDAGDAESLLAHANRSGSRQVTVIATNETEATPTLGVGFPDGPLFRAIYHAYQLTEDAIVRFINFISFRLRDITTSKR